MLELQSIHCLRNSTTRLVYPSPAGEQQGSRGGSPPPSPAILLPVGATLCLPPTCGVMTVLPTFPWVFSSVKWHDSTTPTPNPLALAGLQAGSEEIVRKRLVNSVEFKLQVPSHLGCSSGSFRCNPFFKGPPKSHHLLDHPDPLLIAAGCLRGRREEPTK